jgi:alkylation response protein AidB-like acyl-CoA dehydrogenase
VIEHPPGAERAAATATMSRVHALLPAIAARAPEIEQAVGIPHDLLAALTETGCYRMLAPACYGGDELPLPDALEVVRALASADGAVGWTVGQAAVSQLILSYLPATTLDELYSAGPDLRAAGAIAPVGRAMRQEHGWRVAGRWPFVTGCRDAAWLYLQCLVVGDGTSDADSDEVPATRLVVFPAREVTITDTWHAVGLRGTASHDVRVAAAFCPDARSCALVGARTSIDSPGFRIPLLDQGGLFIAAVAVGIAEGALDDIAALAGVGKRPAFSRRCLAESPGFRERLGEAHLTLRAARALLREGAHSAWLAAIDGQVLPLSERAGLRATPATVTTLSVQAVDAAYRLGGGSAVYDRSPLQRRLRDIHTATQHAWTNHEHAGVLGALLAGQTVDPILF